MSSIFRKLNLHRTVNRAKLLTSLVGGSDSSDGGNNPGSDGGSDGGSGGGDSPVREEESIESKSEDDRDAAIDEKIADLHRRSSMPVEYRCRVKNIDHNMSEKDLKRKFTQYGEVVACKIEKDGSGNSLGEGHVTFKDENSVKNAIEGMNGKDLSGYILTVCRYPPQPPSPSGDGGGGGGYGGGEGGSGGGYGGGGYSYWGGEGGEGSITRIHLQKESH